MSDDLTSPQDGRPTAAGTLGPAARTGAALLVVAAAFALREGLSAGFGELPPFITFYPAVMLSALLCGLYPGLLAILVSAGAYAYWILPPHGQWKLGSTRDAVALGVFVAVGAFMCVVTDAFQRSRRRALELERNAAERREADVALRRYELLAGHVRDGVLFMRREDGRILEANAAAVRAYGYSRRELLGLTIVDLRAPDSLAPTEAQMAEADARGILFETVHRRKDGSTFPVEVSSRGATVEGTRTLVSVVRDITDRERAKERERAAAVRDGFRLRLAEALRTLADPIDIEARAARLLGEQLQATRVHYGEVSDDGQYGVVYDEYRAANVASAVGRYHLDSYGPTVMGEFRAGRTLVITDVAKDPRLTPAEREATARLGIGAYVILPLVKSGRPVAILVVHQAGPRAWTPLDLELMEKTADRTWAAVERARAEHLLRESEARLRGLADSMPQLAWTAQPNGYITWYNRRWYEYTGTTPQDMEGWGWQSVHDPATLPDVLRRWKASLSTGTTFEMEFPLRRADGAFRRFLTRVVPLKDSGGAVVQWFGTNTDVTELVEAREALHDSDRRKSEFIAVLSHELRNPLAPIMNGLYLLDRATDGERAARARAIVRRQAEHLSRLVDDLLDMTRIERGKIELQRSRLDVREVVRRTAEDHRPLFHDRGLELRVELGDPVWVDADGARVAQIVSNLLHNAAKFSQEGGAVTVSVGGAAGHARLRVRDEGIGIPAELLPRLFVPFVQADGGLARTKGGLGLGLALVKGLVELHGGSVRATSAGAGLGAELVVDLPLVDPPPADASAPALAPARRSVEVLVIEDNVDAARSIAEVLELEGHRVHVATDGASGIAKARALRPAVVLCDIGLPDVDGYQIARTLRADAALRQTRLIALSGYAQPDDRRRAAEAGFDEHIPKPPALETLLASVASAGGPQGAIGATPSAPARC